MTIPVVAMSAGDDGDVGLGLGFVVERKRRLLADRPSGAECGTQPLGDDRHADGMAAPLRLGDDQLSADQLDGLVVPEHTDLRETFVLTARPSSPAHGIRRHGHRLYRPPLTRSMSVNGDTVP